MVHCPRCNFSYEHLKSPNLTKACVEVLTFSSVPLGIGYSFLLDTGYISHGTIEIRPQEIPKVLVIDKPSKEGLMGKLLWDEKGAGSINYLTGEIYFEPIESIGEDKILTLEIAYGTIKQSLVKTYKCQ